jgi:hypothetical protein
MILMKMILETIPILIIFRVFNFLLSFAICDKMVEFIHIDGSTSVGIEEIEGDLDVFVGHQLVLVYSRG